MSIKKVCSNCKFWDPYTHRCKNYIGIGPIRFPNETCTFWKNKFDKAEN
jgi:hypothetical protein